MEDNEPKMTKSIKHYTEEYAEDFGVNVKDPERWPNGLTGLVRGSYLLI